MLEYYIDMEKGREIYCALLINLIEYTLKHQQYDATEVLVVQLKLLATDYKEFFHQTVCKFFQGVLLLRTGNQKSGANDNHKNASSHARTGSRSPC